MLRTPEQIPATYFDTASQDVAREMSGIQLFPWSLVEEIVVESGDDTEDLTTKIPPRTTVTGAVIQAVDGATIATGTDIAIGVSGGDINAFCEIPVSGNLDTAYDQYTDTATAAGGVYVAAESTPAITCTDGSGSQDGTFSGTFRVILFGFRTPLIENVA